MFSWRKDKADISGEEPVFHVRYLGYTDAYLSSGSGCTSRPLSTLWDNVSEEKQLHRVVVKMGLAGLELRYLDKSIKDEKKTFPMEHISYCAADKSVNDRLFCWIYKNPTTEQLEAHAVLCSSREKSQTMAAVLSRAFHLAYRDWKAERLREERKKAHSIRRLLLVENFHLHLPEFPANQNLLSTSHKKSGNRKVVKY
ncbi:PTB-containing, cubilin and LRP1-interacting protein [Biomphalaria glabrata]|nr:PTB-containing, cubilin and LRP1-interacting protein [Biomphalaria glabrata]